MSAKVSKLGGTGGGNLTVNFTLVAVGAVLVYAGYKGSSLRNLAQGGEADQVSNASQSGGSFSASGGGGESSGGSGSAGSAGGVGSAPGSPPTGPAPAPSAVKISKHRTVNTKRIAAGLKYKERLERLMAEKRITKGQAGAAFHKYFPNYVKETEGMQRDLQERHAAEGKS